MTGTWPALQVGLGSTTVEMKITIAATHSEQGTKYADKIIATE